MSHNQEQTQQNAVLLLADGSRFEGIAIGKIGTTGGEICFNTGMTGYQEIYTDPSYYGQIVVNTTSHIGNYGVHRTKSKNQLLLKLEACCERFLSRLQPPYW